MIFLVKLYRLIVRPFIGPCCRFYPSCSDYAMEALKAHGQLKGSWLTIKRLFKCGPWHRGGYDPIPPPEKKPDSQPKAF